MSTSMISIPQLRLSTDPHRRHAELRDYFCDKDAEAISVDDCWNLTLNWSNDPLRYVDPRLDDGLKWWGAGIQYHEMATARKRRGRVMLSLNDTWTLESWSLWLSGRSHQTRPEVVVLHVDDHKDLAPPRLFRQLHNWHDPITGHEVDLEIPDSVRHAVESGALGMGSFLTPYLHYAPQTDVRHLCQAPKCVGTEDSLVQLNWVPDTLIDPLQQRPAICLVKEDQRQGSGRYRFTDDLEAWLEGVNISGKDILLHVDMDYFCNRYDGDSDAIENPCALDVPLEEILARIDAMTAALRQHDLLDRLVDVAIAFSPGFFPAEFWKPTCDRLLVGIGELPWSGQ